MCEYTMRASCWRVADAQCPAMVASLCHALAAAAARHHATATPTAHLLSPGAAARIHTLLWRPQRRVFSWGRRSSGDASAAPPAARSESLQQLQGAAAPMGRLFCAVDCLGFCRAVGVAHRPIWAVLL